MEKNSRKKGLIAQYLLLVFFLIGAVLIINDVAANISLEMTEDLNTDYSYISQIDDRPVESSETDTPMPTPTINPILIDINQ
ncbi:hypothetical protein KQH40_00080 [bacterium]|nr:hypothetical protein [bacterium]